MVQKGIIINISTSGKSLKQKKRHKVQIFKAI